MKVRLLAILVLVSCGKVDSGAPDAAISPDARVGGDGVALAFGTAPPATAQAEATIPTFTVEVQDASGAVVTSDNDTLITITGSTGAYSGAGTFGGNVSRAAVNGVATFDNLTWRFAERVSFTASASGLTGPGDRSITFTAVPSTKLLVADQLDQKVFVFDINASGQTAPLQTITGANTTIMYSWGVGFDPVSDEIVVSNYGGQAVLRFPITADGDVAPSSALMGPTTLLAGPSRPFIDPIHDELYEGQEQDGSVVVYSRTASGDAAPLRRLSNTATGIAEMDSAMVDYETDELYATGFGGSQVDVFPRTASGDGPPTRTIVGPSTLLSTPFELVVIPEQNELLVANAGSGILTFALDASGDVAPIRQINGTSGTAGFAYDPATDLLFVANQGTKTVTVFHRTDNGDVTPVRQLDLTPFVTGNVADVALAR